MVSTKPPTTSSPLAEASLFSEMMVGIHSQEPPAFTTIIDVGGATGNMLATILADHAGPRGILFDRPYVVKDARALLAARGVSDRVQRRASWKPWSLERDVCACPEARPRR
jgi:hypothetical protein